jgi:hypothetical protein
MSTGGRRAKKGVYIAADEAGCTEVWVMMGDEFGKPRIGSTLQLEVPR